MTASEIHCMMTAGFACIAGALFSAYIALGRMKFAERDNEETILECITASSIRTSHFAIAIGANWVTYIALLAFLNSTIGWLGSMVGIAELSFNKILGFLLLPIGLGNGRL
ncbi:hypothetical protein niasHS_008976 [Heterodera schachtii]|uniref:Concentrative nucleoside transporter C-terminal domain-containing protein n=1 Tax=Heterodera schachtii TaxID=97005 RepID=A0ABD2J1H9_HETSC